MRISTPDERAEADAPALCVIITCHNQAAFLADAVASLKAQAFADWEAVIVDDGSTDDTPQAALGLIAGDRRLSVLRKQNGGVSSARNAGIRASNPFAQYVLFLDADDALLPGALGILTALLDTCPGAVAAMGRPVPARADLTPDPAAWTFAPPVEGLLDFPRLADEAVMYPPSVALLRRWATDAAGPFDATMPWEDRDFFLRLALLGPFVFTAADVTLYRRHGENATNRGEEMRRGERDAALKLRSYRAAWRISSPRLVVENPL